MAGLNFQKTISASATGCIRSSKALQQMVGDLLQYNDSLMGRHRPSLQFKRGLYSSCARRPEDEEYYYPSNFIDMPCSTEDIPSPETYTRRYERIEQKRLSDAFIPENQPIPYIDASTWSGQSLSSDEFCLQLSLVEIDEIELALLSFSSKPLLQLSRSWVQANKSYCSLCRP